MTTREVIALGHLMAAKQALVEVDFETAARSIDKALDALRRPASAQHGPWCRHGECGPACAAEAPKP